MVVHRTNSVIEAYHTTTIAGGVTGARVFTIALGAGAEFIVLQQPWVLFAGEHGIDPQHCMLCWSGVIADAQSAIWRTNTAPKASTKNSLFPLIFFQLRSNCRPKSSGDDFMRMTTLRLLHLLHLL